MTDLTKQIILSEEAVISKIYLIRGQKVMLDADLAELYEVETKQLKRAVKRNIERFPDDFMFELTDKELKNLRSQIGTSSWGGVRYTPLAFTEQGVSMLSSVLNSKTAIKVNIQIIRIFTKMREMLITHKELILEIEQIKHQLTDHDNNFLMIFEYLKRFEESKQQKLEQTNRKRIGFKP
jgi:hypothetical protein